MSFHLPHHTLSEVRDILGLPKSASSRDIVSKVRETKAAADLAGAALEVREHFTPHADRRGTRDHRIA